MSDRFDEALDEFENQRENNDETDETQDDVNRLESGDSCPKECEHTVYEIHHEAPSQLGAKPHDSFNSVEVCCVHHGIVDTA